MTEYSIKSSDGTYLYYKYSETGNNGICICFIHGLNDNSTSFDSIIEYFIKKGFSVSTFDFRCHGKSEWKKGLIKSFDLLLEDFEAFLSETKFHFPDHKYIIYGHGVGALVVLQDYLLNPKNFNGFILSAPIFKPYNEYSKFLIKCLFFIKNIFSFVLIPNRLSSANEENNNIKPTNRITLRLLTEILILGKKLMGMGFRINIPFLLIQGKADKVSQLKSSNVFLRNTGYFTTSKIWDNLPHQLHNCEKNNEIFEYIYNWIKDKFIENK